MVVRSFMFDNYPFSLDRCKKKEIEEGYVLEEPEILVRKIDDECFYITRMEEEVGTIISENVYSFFIRNAKNVTNMTRYIVPLYDDVICNLDFYHDSDFKVATVCFKDIDDSEGFYPPVWFGKEIKDVKELKRAS